MTRLKKLLKSGRNIVILSLLAVICITLIILIKEGVFIRGSTNDSDITPKPTGKSESKENIIAQGKVFLDKSIDSVLFTYGIKKEWIIL